MGFLPLNLDHHSVPDRYLHAATMIAKGTPGIHLFGAIFSHLSNLLNKSIKISRPGRPNTMSGKKQ
jgi:hypothetical protein